MINLKFSQFFLLELEHSLSKFLLRAARDYITLIPAYVIDRSNRTTYTHSVSRRQ